MSDGGAVRSIRPSEVGEATRLLTRAFVDNPGMVWSLPDPSRRSRQVEWIMKFMVQSGLHYGRVEVLGEPFVAVSVWYPPEKRSLSFVELLKVGVLSAPFALGMRDFVTMMRSMGELDSARAKAAPDPHSYLHLLGVEPKRQRQGLGGRLLTAALARPELSAKRWYLEADHPENVPFYEKHGFRVVEEIPMCGRGGTIWTMRREPNV